MKGIIDIQIKHKDGSVETRHEHNVVFDLQALATNYFYNRPYGPMTGYLKHKYISSDTYKTFSLSTLELDLTKPSVAIPALNSISSGSSSVWHTAPITSTINDKSRISSATWTIGEAITLKSIFFPYNDLNFGHDTYTGSESRCVLCDDGLFVDSDRCKRLSPSMDGFKFTNNYLNGFCSTSSYDSSNTAAELAFIPYKLHDPTERFLFDTVSGTTHSYRHYPYYTTGELQIKDAVTNTVKRSFNLSQFANFVAGYNTMGQYARIVNTGSKNFLLQPVSTAEGLRVWEIPDTATTETIQPSGMILADKGIFVGYGSSNTYSDTYLVADNVLMWTSRTSSSNHRMHCARINDDLSVDFVPGANATGLSVSSSSSYNYYILPYMNTDSPWFYRVWTNNSYTSPFNNYSYYDCRFFNSTAANFSTPIVLAEGDVLTVSYKIEVA